MTSFDYATENTYVNGQLVNEHINVQSNHYKLIREIGSASTVLLKNTAHSQFTSQSSFKTIIDSPRVISSASQLRQLQEYRHLR